MRICCDKDRGQPVWRLRLEPDPGKELVLSAAGIDQLRALLAEAELSPRCRMLVLEGQPGSFCRGMDLQLAAAGEVASAGVQQYAECLRALRACSRPLLALVDGAVLAGGVGLVAAADIVIATRRSSFGLPETVLGLLPAMVLPFLLERMPAQKARRLALMAQTIEADEARALGLVDRLVDDDDALERALRASARQLLRVEPGAAARLKALCARLSTLSWQDGLTAGAACTAELLEQPERRAAIGAFVAGEPLPWFERYRPQSPEPGAE